MASRAPEQILDGHAVPPRNKAMDAGRQRAVQMARFQARATNRHHYVLYMGSGSYDWVAVPDDEHLVTDIVTDQQVFDQTERLRPEVIEAMRLRV